MPGIVVLDDGHIRAGEAKFPLLTAIQVCLECFAKLTRSRLVVLRGVVSLFCVAVRVQLGHLLVGVVLR